jgi:glycosyltransferase involved in cell wall biosynthesis
MRKKIVIVTTGQPSTNPRMVKEYQALKRAGFEVTVLYSYWVDWAVKTDEILFEKGDLDRNDFILIGGSPSHHRQQYWFSRIIHKVSRQMMGFWPGLFAAFAIARPAYFLWRASRKIKADLYIAHNLGALPPAVWAARKHKAAAGFDLEDLYSGQFDPSFDKMHATAVYLERKFLPACNFLIAASPLIAEAYEPLVNRSIPVINNVFSKAFLQTPVKRVDKTLRLFWFSQTVGENRGLETIVQAIKLLPDYNIQFHVMGSCSDDFRQRLSNMAHRSEAIHFLPPVPADDLFSVAASYDIGMASEVPHNENRDRCLTNKLFVYLTAGNCVLASDTKAQRLFMEQHPGIGHLYGHNNPEELAGYLEAFYNEPDHLQQCKQQAYDLAIKKYNWESEEGLLLSQIRNIPGLV